MALLLETLYGDLVIDLDVEGSPELCRNIIHLAYCRYYTNTLLFNVTSQRFCQFGCPIGDGTGGACIYGLIDAVKNQNHNPSFDYKLSKYRFLKSIGRTLTPLECQEKGRVVATQMNNTPDTIGSQFLITTANGPDHALDGYINNTGFTDDSNALQSQQFLSLGKVVEDDHHVLDKINAAYCDPNGRPYADIRIVRALVIYDPFESSDTTPIHDFDVLLRSRGVIVNDRRVTDSPNPDRPSEESVPKRISVVDVGIKIDDYDANLDDDEKYEEEQLRQRRIDEEVTAKKVDHSRAVVLEMIGDLPDANIRAPENVLFICKLNPVTIDEDLELIFSRFDERIKVEIIRDVDTGQSLQYAFAEFTSQQAAAEAYFKMNNALIDDRRIKVDFSQSVAKLWDRYHQRMKMPVYNNNTNNNQSSYKHQHASTTANNASRNNNDKTRTKRENSNNVSNQSGRSTRPGNNDTDHRQRNEVHGNYRSRNQSDNERYRRSHQQENNSRRHENERKKRDRVDDNETNEHRVDRRRTRTDSFENYNDKRHHSIDRVDHNDRHSPHRNDAIQQPDDGDDDSRRRYRRHHDSRHHHHSRHSEDDQSVDSRNGKQHRHHRRKKSSRSRDEAAAADDDISEPDRRHQHHKHRKKKHEQDRDHGKDRDRSPNKHRRRSRSESR